MERKEDNHNDPRPLAVWSAPRALSHAFEKMMRARGDHIIFSEPFNDPWYFGPERGTHRQSEMDPSMTYESRLTPILEAAKTSRVYVRSQPWQFGTTYMNKEMLTLFKSSLLIRDPAYSLPSLYKVKPDFIEEEAGYIGLHTAWKILLACAEQVPIIDATDIQHDPTGIIQLWCDAVSIETNPDALNWEKGFEASWGNWKEYVAVAESSTGFHKPPTSFPKVPNERVAKLIDSSRRYYREMETHKISTSNTTFEGKRG